MATTMGMSRAAFQHEIDTHKARMERAFRLVDPAERARELVERGIIPESAAASVSWRDEIAAVVTDEQLAEARVTIDDVKQSIAFFTATEAYCFREAVGSLPWVAFLRCVGGWMVRADGYRKGPAGP